MADMAKPASGTSGLRRARAAAWTVFLSMCGTTIAFQVYHSVKFGQMPTLLAVLFGVVLLLISVCVLEFVTAWHGSHWWIKAAAYLLMGGSMYMSAGATGEVVVHAAPPHMSLLFGFLLDGAALLSVHFLLSGSPALSRAMAGEEAARQAFLETARTATAAERAAREAAEAELAVVRGDLAAAAAAVREAEAERSALEAERSARAVAEAERDAAVSAQEGAQQAAAEALTRAEALAQKLAALSDQKPRKQPRASAQRTARESAQGDDLTTELRALMELKADPGLCKPRMGGELARRLGVSGATGRRLHSRLTIDGRVADPLTERSAEEPDARSGERS